MGDLVRGWRTDANPVPRGTPKAGRCLLVLAAVLSLPTCEDVPAAPVTDFGTPWTTEPEFEFGEGVGGDADASFGFISTVRILGSGERILVAEVGPRITIWSLDGAFVRTVGGPGEGPGEFGPSISVQLHDRGFHVNDNRRFTSFSSDGTLIETIPFPPRPAGGFAPGYEALLADGSMLAVPKLSPLEMWGFDGRPPIETVPVLRLSEEDGRWIVDTVATLDTRNRAIVITPEGTSAWGGAQSEQMFGDYDRTWFDPVAASVIVVRRNLGGGQVELLEIEADGDTIWTRRLSLPPVSLAPDRVDAVIDNLASQLSGQGQTPFARMRTAVQEAIYIPDPLPGVRRVYGTASRELWFNGFETENSLSVWYSVERGGGSDRVRRVLLPSGFRVTDVTETHVWGVRDDDLGVQYVSGRRLVPPSG